MKRFLPLLKFFRSISPMLVGSAKGILCLNLTLAIPLLALLGWILFGSSGDSHTNTKIARCLGLAAGGFLANLPVGALMGAVAPSLRKLRWLKLVGIGLLAAVAEILMVRLFAGLGMQPLTDVYVWFMWAVYGGGVLALLPVAWVLERWTRPPVRGGSINS
jgi:hypothetical protein